MSHNGADSALESSLWTCERCGCDEDNACRVEVIVTNPKGERITLVVEECAWSAPRLCTACDERLLPELKTLIGVWRQLGAIATMFRST